MANQNPTAAEIMAGVAAELDWNSLIDHITDALGAEAGRAARDAIRQLQQSGQLPGEPCGHSGAVRPRRRGRAGLRPPARRCIKARRGDLSPRALFSYPTARWRMSRPQSRFCVPSGGQGAGNSTRCGRPRCATVSLGAATAGAAGPGNRLDR